MIIEPKIPSKAVITYLDNSMEELDITDWYFGEYFILLERKPSIIRINRDSVKKVEITPK